MFSSDYAHWDFDSPVDAFPRLPDDLRRCIFYETASELYRFHTQAAPVPDRSRSTTSEPV